MPVLTAYCTKLRRKVEMDQIELVTMKNGRRQRRSSEGRPQPVGISHTQQGRGGRAGQGTVLIAFTQSAGTCRTGQEATNRARLLRRNEGPTHS